MRNFILILVVVILNSGCYSFKGFTIDCNTTKTFTIIPLDNNASSAPATININFGELLRDKVLSETCLSSTTANGDVEFSGEVFKFSVSSVAPSAEETNLLNRLTIGIAIEFVNHQNPKESYKKRYEWYEEYDSNENLLTVQDRLIAAISEQIIANIFNDAFTNW
jgi:hypothetical protein